VQLTRPRNSESARGILDQALQAIRKPWNLVSLRWERRRNWRFEHEAWAVRTRLQIYKESNRTLAAAGVDFYLPHEWPQERFESFFSEDEYSRLHRSLLAEGYKPFATSGSQAANCNKIFNATSTAIRHAKSALDRIVFGRAGAAGRSLAKDAFETAALEFARKPKWEPAGAVWVCAHDFKLSRRGAVHLRLQLLQESGALNPAKLEPMRLFPASLIRVIPTGPDRLGTITRVTPILAQAGYRGGPTSYFSGRTLRPLSPVGEFERRDLGPEGIAAEGERLVELATRLGGA
jgi:hypothetical protein